MPSVKEIKELKHGQAGKITWSAEEWHRLFEVIMEPDTGEITGCSSNGIEQAFYALASELSWTRYSAPTYPGRDWLEPESDTDGSDLTPPGALPLFATECTGHQVEGEPVYVFDVKYETVKYDFSNGTYSSYPWLQPCQISWTVKPYTKVIDHDFIGHPVVNSAGELFVPPVEGQEFHPTVTIVRNEFSWSPNYIPTFIANYIDTVNISSITIAGMSLNARAGKITNLSATRKDFYGWPYYECTYEIELNPNLWDVWLLDAGLNSLDPVSKKLHSIHADGVPRDKPALLNGAGQELDGDPDSDGWMEYTGVYKGYICNELTDFSALSLPTNMNDTGILY